MINSDIVDIIGQDFRIVKIGNGLYSTYEHDSLTIFAETNSWYWYSRGIGGNATRWLKYYRHLTDEDISGSYETYEVTPDPFKTLMRKNYVVEDVDISLLYGSKTYSEYIKSRGINYETFMKYDLEMIGNSHCIIPIKDRKGKRVGALHRKIDDTIRGVRYKKYFNDNSSQLFIFNYEKLKFGGKHGIILVFEGAWSAMRFDQVLGDKVQCLATLSNKLDVRIFELLNGLENVYFVLDNDAAGMEITKKYPNRKFIVPSIYPDDLTDEQIVKVYDRIKTKCQTNYKS